MTTELQDLAWSILPKEFKEEVKSLYEKFYNEKPNSDCSYGYLGLLIKLFGIHNLTSDAEGEELLTVKAKTVREMYAANERLAVNFPPSIADTNADAINHVLRHLFGSKCLPDEKASKSMPLSEPKPAEPKVKRGDRVRIIKQNHLYYGKTGTVDTLVKGAKGIPPEVLVNLGGNLIAFYESDLEPITEPKFKVGDEAFYVCSPTLKHKCTVTKVMQNEHNGKWEYNVMFEWGKPGMWIPESDLEPYTEQEASTCTYDCSSQCTSPDHIADASKKADDDLCDKLMRRGFRDHNRLNIATRIATAILGNPDEVYRAKTCGKGEQIPQNIAEYAVAIADALISEAERKGGSK